MNLKVLFRGSMFKEMELSGDWAAADLARL